MSVLDDAQDFCNLKIDSKSALQPFVTELDLKLAHLPPSAIDYLREVMPAAENGGGDGVSEEDGGKQYDYQAWLDRVFDY